MDFAGTLRVPASSANLGPGFDALAIALNLHLVCGFEKNADFSIEITGRDAGLIPASEGNLIWKTALDVAARTGRKLPRARLSISNEIPIGKGLGSSAAAITAGVAIADSLLQLGWDATKVLDMAAAIEGHPDNVAACVLGSVVVSAAAEDGCTRAIRLEMPRGFAVSVIVPDYELATKQARAVLPDCCSMADAVFNLQRSTLLVAALARGDSSVFPMALEDRLHQPFRARLIPGLEEILALRKQGLLGCVLSGAGPAVLVFHKPGAEEVCESVRAVFARNGCAAEAMPVGVCGKGLERG